MHGNRFLVTVLSRDPDLFFKTSPEFLSYQWIWMERGSLTNIPAPRRKVTDVIHAAADTHDMSDGVAWIDQIVGGTRAVLDWSVTAGAKRFLLTSSGAIYGSQPCGTTSLDESNVGAPPTTLVSSVYGQAKRLAEQLCTIYSASGRLETVIARCFALIGPHIPIPGPYAIGNFIFDVLNDEDVRIRGDGKTIRTYLYGRDMAHWLVTLLIRGEAGNAYNVGSDEEVTLEQVARLIVSTTCSKSQIIIENVIPRDNTRSTYIPNISKAKELGLRVETPIIDAIRGSVARLTRQI